MLLSWWLSSFSKGMTSLDHANSLLQSTHVGVCAHFRTTRIMNSLEENAYHSVLHAILVLVDEVGPPRSFDLSGEIMKGLVRLLLLAFKDALALPH